MKILVLALACVSAQAAMITGTITGGTISGVNAGISPPGSFTFVGDAPLGTLSFSTPEAVRFLFFDTGHLLYV